MFKNISKSLLTVFVLGGIFFAASFSSRVYAVDVTGSNGGPCNNSDATSTPAICSDTQSSTSSPLFGQGGILTDVINWLSMAAGVIAVIFIIIQGLRIVISNGDSQTMASARNGIIFALVGLAVAVLAQLIVIFVLDNIK